MLRIGFIVRESFGRLQRLAAGLLLTLAAWGPAWAGDCRLVRLAGPADMPPVAWERDRQLVGIAPDLARMLLLEQGIDAPEGEAMPPARLPLELERGGSDLAVAIDHTERREQAAIFVRPAFTVVAIAVWTRREAPVAFEDIDDLAGREGATTLGLSFGEALDDEVKARLKLHRAAGPKILFPMLASARVDYVLYPQRHGLLAVAALGLAPKIDARPRPFSRSEMHLAFARKSACAGKAEAIGLRLTQLMADGTVDRLFARHAQEWLRDWTQSESESGDGKTNPNLAPDLRPPGGS